MWSYQVGVSIMRNSQNGIVIVDFLETLLLFQKHYAFFQSIFYTVRNLFFGNTSTFSEHYILSEPNYIL